MTYLPIILLIVAIVLLIAIVNPSRTRKGSKNFQKQNEGFSRLDRERTQRTRNLFNDQKKRTDRVSRQQEQITRNQIKRGRGW